MANLTNEQISQKKVFVKEFLCSSLPKGFKDATPGLDFMNKWTFENPDGDRFLFYLESSGKWSVYPTGQEFGSDVVTMTVEVLEWMLLGTKLMGDK